MPAKVRSEEWKRQLEARLEEFCRKRGYVLSPSKEAIIRDMVSMRELTGDFYCPCQPGETADTVCVCLPVRQGVVDDEGACFCHLILKKEEIMPAASVVTAERFAKGYTYKDYLTSIKANKDQFERNEKEFTLKAEDAKFFADQGKRLAGVKVVAVGEDWCPDVWRGLPIMSRVADAAGLEMRVFPRDQNMDIENEHLNQGKFASIPVFAVYSAAFRPLKDWIERPKAAIEFYDKLNKDLAGMPEEQARTERRSRSAPEQEKWRQETVRELKELLASL